MVVRCDDEERRPGSRTGIVHFAEYRRGSGDVRAVEQRAARHTGGKCALVLMEMRQPDFHQILGLFFCTGVASTLGPAGTWMIFCGSASRRGPSPNRTVLPRSLLGFQGPVLASSRQQRAPEIPRSQSARIRALVKYGMSPAQVAEVYGVAIGAIQSILRKV